MNKQNKKHKNTQKGITLIALVITIIILLILAMVSIRLVMNSGIISRAEKGVDEYSKAEADEQAQLLQAEYEMAKYEGKATGSFTDYVLETKYNGVQIGDYVNYDEGTGTTYTTDTTKGVGTSTGTQDSTTGKYQLNSKTYTVEKDGGLDLNWRVLGVNSKGELELISDTPTTDTVYLANEEGYLYGPDELNRICNELYGKGEHATGARSLNVDDINNLIDTGYDPKTYSGYGEKWTYRYPTEQEKIGDTRYMQYRTDNSDGTQKTEWTNITDPSYQIFRIPGEEETISSSNVKESKELLKTHYAFGISTNVITKTTKDGKNMSDIIIKGTKSSDVMQWLASRCDNIYPQYATFNVRFINGGITSVGLFYSYGLSGKSAYGFSLRPVVTLSSDIQLNGSSEAGWAIN